MTDRNLLRQRMRANRAQLSGKGQRDMAERIVDQVCNSAIFYESKNISAYIAQGGEIITSPILNLAWQLEKNCYLPIMPILSEEKTMRFARYDSSDELVVNRYGITEPVVTAEKIISISALDLILVPLVAFDKTGNRIGMGSGCYDATFSFLKNKKRPSKPFLLGLAYEWQCCETTYPEEWDIRMDAIATENTIHFISQY